MCLQGKNMCLHQPLIDPRCETFSGFLPWARVTAPPCDPLPYMIILLSRLNKPNQRQDRCWSWCFCERGHHDSVWPAPIPWTWAAPQTTQSASNVGFVNKMKDETPGRPVSSPLLMPGLFPRRVGGLKVGMKLRTRRKPLSTIPHSLLEQRRADSRTAWNVNRSSISMPRSVFVHVCLGEGGGSGELEYLIRLPSVQCES